MVFQPHRLFTMEPSVSLEIRPELDFETIRGQAGIPAHVRRGIIGGFTLPVYAADNQELFLTIHIPRRWDGASDIMVHVAGYLDNANNTKKFRFQLEWENITPGTNVIPATNNPVIVETTTGNWAQFQSYSVDFTIDYDIDGGGAEILPEDELYLRLIRLAATEDEIAGNPVVTHIGVTFCREILGPPV